VAGEPLVAFATRAGLGVRARLEIFRKICAAVSYAHAKLVVHRDLKPSNILVTAGAEPKLIDFGLAKLLDTTLGEEGVKQTVEGWRAFTPAYASPEQVHGQPLTTATDVYSLGVVLYELLTGRTPFDFGAGTMADMLRTLDTTDAERPSDVLTRRAGLDVEPASRPPYRGAALAGDLDNIVLTAVRREPARRYPSVEAMADDVGRHLEGRPVTAHPSTLRYRAGKFVRRHTAAVVATALAVCAVVGGLTVSLREAGIAREQRDRATRRFEDVRRLSNSLLFELSPRIERLPGATGARDLLVRRALEYLDGLATESADDPGLQRELASAYEKIGDLEGNPTNPNIIEFDAAIASYLKAREIRQRLSRADEPAARRALAENFRVLGNIYSQANDFDSAARDLAEARRRYTTRSWRGPRTIRGCAWRWRRRCTISGATSPTARATLPRWRRWRSRSPLPNGCGRRRRPTPACCACWPRRARSTGSRCRGRGASRRPRRRWRRPPRSTSRWRRRSRTTSRCATGCGRSTG
jgi:hypothetical protein